MVVGIDDIIMGGLFTFQNTCDPPKIMFRTLKSVINLGGRALSRFLARQRLTRY